MSSVLKMVNNFSQILCLTVIYALIVGSLNPNTSVGFYDEASIDKTMFNDWQPLTSELLPQGNHLTFLRCDKPTINPSYSRSPTPMLTSFSLEVVVRIQSNTPTQSTPIVQMVLDHPYGIFANSSFLFPSADKMSPWSALSGFTKNPRYDVGKFYHIVVTQSAKTVKMFVNGVEKHSESSAFTEQQFNGMQLCDSSRKQDLVAINVYYVELTNSQVKERCWFWNNENREAFSGMCPCKKSTNYNINGTTLLVHGDPHTKLWNGGVIAYQGAQQGSTLDQYYYVTRCSNVPIYSMPWSVLLKHEDHPLPVRYLDYVTLELIDINGDLYLVWLNGNEMKSYSGPVTAGTSTLYNPSSTQIHLDQWVTIGTRFKIKVTHSYLPHKWIGGWEVSAIGIAQQIIQLRIDNSPTKTIDFTIIEASTKGIRHAELNIDTPPNFYKCFICGIGGGFKNGNCNPNANCTIETCNGGNYTQVPNLMVYTPGGLTWKKSSSCVRGSQVRRLNTQSQTVNTTAELCPPGADLTIAAETHCGWGIGNFSDMCNGTLRTVCNFVYNACIADACHGSHGNLSEVPRLTLDIMVQLSVHNDSRAKYEELYDPKHLLVSQYAANPAKRPTLQPKNGTSSPTSSKSSETSGLHSKRVATQLLTGILFVLSVVN